MSLLHVRGLKKIFHVHLLTCVSACRSEVKERVVWVDTKKTQVKNKAGKLKEKEVTILEVCLFVQI